MIKSLVAGITRQFTTGKERSIKAKKNIAASFLIKGLSIIINLLLVPLTLHYLNPTRYGIWITLYSIVGWFSFFDIGLGNGLRNKFAEALAKGDREKARIYVSTTYGILIIIVTVLFLIFIVVNQFLDWTVLLNTPKELGNELSSLVLIVFGFFCIKFVLQLISTILTADQKPAYTSLFNLGNNLIALSAIFILTKTTSGSLLYLGLAISAAPIIIFIIASLYFYKNDYKEFIPSSKYINFTYAKDLIALGSRFFLVQISGIILFATDNIIISQLFGPAEVTPYNVAYKYFSIILLFFGIVNAPFWSAYTEAFSKNDSLWIKKTIYSLKRIWLLLASVALIMLIISKYVYVFWIGDSIQIPFFLSFLMFIYVLEYSFGSIFITFINGVGKIRLQLYISIFIGILNVPLSIFLAKYLNMGTAGVITATIICILYGPIFAQIQYRKIINYKSKGIWGQ